MSYRRIKKHFVDSALRSQSSNLQILHWEIVFQVDEEEERGRLKRATTSKMESLMKELETLMTHNGTGCLSGIFHQHDVTSSLHLPTLTPPSPPPHAGFPFLTPVIGFYCRKCEEFFGDWNSAESHAAMHCCPWSTVSTRSFKHPVVNVGGK